MPRISRFNRSNQRRLRSPRRLNPQTSFQQLEARRFLSASGGDCGVEVTETTIVTCHDVVPRFVVVPSDVAVQDGDWTNPSTWADGSVPSASDLVRIPEDISVNFDSIGAIDALEVLGSLRFNTHQNTLLTVNTITVLPMGTLTLGTESNPVYDSVTAQIVFRDSELQSGTAENPGIDTEQFGGGLLVFGQFETNGMNKTPFVRATTDILRGDTSIELESMPFDWQVGDTLLLPETAQNVVEDKGTSLEQNETRTIVGIVGNTVHLSAATDFHHKGVSDNPFEVSAFAHISNLTRNVVLQSENADGVRGHLLATGNGVVSIQDTHVLSMGRTRSDVQLDNTITDPETGELFIGTNQIARYSIHFHHLHNPAQVIGSVVQDNLKWGITIHSTNDVLVQGNIIYDTDGSGVMTEDGTETGNQFLNNLVVKVDGGPFRSRGGIEKIFDQLGNQTVQTGTDGSGFWFRSAGSAGTVVGNTVYDAEGYGFNLNGYYRGGNLGTVDAFVGNEVVSSHGGLWLTWSQGQQKIADHYQRQTFEDLLIWHTQKGVNAFHDGFYSLKDVTIIGDAAVSSENQGSHFNLGRSSVGIALGNPSYENFDVIMDGIRVSGQNVGYSQPHHEGPGGTILRDAIFANYINLAFRESTDQAKVELENINFLPSKVSKISAGFPAMVANKYASDTGIIEEGELSDELPPPPPSLPASIKLINGLLKISGSSGNDEVFLIEDGANLRVVSQGQETTLDRTLVSSYLFYAGAGNDLFDNQSSVGGTVLAGNGDDMLIGGSGADKFLGEDGNDTIYSNGGNDRIYGGDGDDVIDGGEGSDVIYGEAGDDLISGGDGSDLLFGGAGMDLIEGGLGNDSLLGGRGNDQLFGDEGNDKIHGDEGDDVLFGGMGNDLLYGDLGNDYVQGGEGYDKVRGGAGMDWFFASSHDAVLDFNELEDHWA